MEAFVMQQANTNFHFLKQKIIYWKISDFSSRSILENQALNKAETQ